MKRTFTKVLSVVLCAVMVLGAAPLGGLVGLELPGLFDFKAEATIINSLLGANQWTIDTDTGHLEIGGWGGFSGTIPDFTNYSETPWYDYRSYVKSVEIYADGIGKYAFGNLDSAQTVSLTNNVASIGDYAFYDCDKLGTVTFGTGVTSIGDCAFMSCDSLSKITIPENVASIGKSAFESTTLSEIIIPNGTSTIGYRAFYNCTNLKNAEIADSVALIGDNAFYGCVSIETVTIGNGVETIGYNAFEGCTNITDVFFNGTKSEWNEIFIDEGNEALLNAEIHYAQTEITGSCGENIIWTLYESGLLEITGTGAMTNYSSSSSAPWYSYRNNIKTATIASGITSIGDSAFSSCDSLTSVTIPDSVKTIGNYAFCNCGLTSVTIPNSVTTIGNYAFSNCDSLTSVTIGNSVTSIGSYAFRNCDSLTSVTISNSVTTIGDYAFLSCTSLASIKIPGSVKIISWDAFKDCTGLTSAIIGNGVTTIDSGVFAGCTSLTSVTIPNSVKSIGDSAFSGCTSLASIKIPDSVKSIGDNAFAGCDKLTNVIIPDSLTSIIWCTFYSCDSLANVIIGNSVTTIGERAFYWCTGLTSITIPDSVTTIGDRAFDNCNSLTDIYYMGSESQWKSISIKAYNSALRNAKIHYNHVHALNNVKESVDPTCTETGYKTGTCVCGYGIITEEIPALNHKDTLVKVAAKAPTCTEIGWDAYEYCTACTYTTYAEKAALKHDIIIDKAVDATCTETGLTEGQHCSRCDDATIKQDVVPALNHKDTLVKVEAKAPTCTEIGWDAYEYCTACTYTTYVEKAALKHDIIIDKAVDATCTETGLTEGQHCSRCDDMTIKQEVMPALKHKDTLVKVAAKAPTCTEIGWDAYEYCTACTYTTYVEKAALRHDIIIDKAVDATCTETGLTEGQHCSRCDDATIKQEIVPALKHDIIIDKAVDATCTETGLTEGQHCSRCDGMTVEQEVVPVKPHSYTAKHDSAKHWEECVCGSKINVQNHSFVGGNVCSCGFKRTVDSTIKINNNNGSKTINYGETLKLMSTVTDKPANAKIYWYVDGELKGEGEIFEVKFESGTKIITVKLVDANGVVYQNANGEEISESENVTVNAGFFQKLISFFKNLFRMNRTVVQ